MMIKSCEEIIIYESPDGGKTVYARKSGDSSRQLVSETQEVKEAQRWVKWKEILDLAKTEPSLNDLIVKAEMTYELLK
jgi:hypothetical protein